MRTIHEYIRDCFQFSKSYVRHGVSQKGVVSRLLGCLPCPQHFDGVSVGLVINENVVSWAKENEIIVQIPILLRQIWISSRAVVAMRLDVGNLPYCCRGIVVVGWLHTNYRAVREAA